MSFDMETISTGDLQDPGFQFLLFSQCFSGILLRDTVFENANRDGMLSRHNIHTIYFLLTEECYSK